MACAYVGFFPVLFNLSHKVEEIKEGRYVAMVKAARKAKHKVTVAYEKELKKPQQNHSETLSVSAAQVNKYKDITVNLRARNLETSTTSKLKICKLKQNNNKKELLDKKGGTTKVLFG